MYQSPEDPIVTALKHAFCIRYERLKRAVWVWEAVETKKAWVQVTVLYAALQKLNGE
jgi:hypothetical protein